MNNFFISFLFAIFTLIVLVKIISYCFYEIKNENNAFGGICTIVFSIASVIFSNVMVWIN